MDREESGGVPVVTAEDYVSAERFLNGEGLVFNAEVNPHWLSDSQRFWYRSRTRDGCEFILVEPDPGVRRQAFDHQRLASALSVASADPCVHHQLPFDEFEFTEDERAIVFETDRQRWRCDLDTYSCTKTAEDEDSPGPGVTSPDGRWTAFVRNHNLHVTDDSGRVLTLTEDGGPGCDYAVPVPSPLRAAGIDPADGPSPALLWSPDSHRILTHRISCEGAGQFHLVQSVPLDGNTRPKLHSYTYPLPGDERVPLAELVILDVRERTRCPVQADPLPVLYYGSPLRPEWTWWSGDGTRIYVVRRERGYQGYSLIEIDAETGESRTVLEEQARTAIDPHLTSMGSPNIRTMSDGEEVIWFSQRDGWGHIYLYDGEGNLRNRITSGHWAVADIVCVDEKGRRVYFTGVGREPGRDPYYCHLYRASLDGGDPELLTPEDAHHEIAFSPDGSCFIDTYSRIDLPPVSVLRTRDGRGARHLAGNRDSVRDR
ncbi:MAG: DPP IV N-terminal domain-containing protein [Bacillota bacterium]